MSLDGKKEHIRASVDATRFAMTWIKAAVRDGRNGKCNAALASAENAIEFAVRANTHMELALGERQMKPLRVLVRARRVHRALVQRCAGKPEVMSARFARHLAGLAAPKRRRR